MRQLANQSAGKMGCVYCVNQVSSEFFFLNLYLLDDCMQKKISFANAFIFFMFYLIILPITHYKAVNGRLISK